VPKANGAVAVEPLMDVRHVARAVVHADSGNHRVLKYTPAP
jgi:hypothetical protein